VLAEAADHRVVAAHGSTGATIVPTRRASVALSDSCNALRPWGGKRKEQLAPAATSRGRFAFLGSDEAFASGRSSVV
jgi:hypothetical protein